VAATRLKRWIVGVLLGPAGIACIGLAAQGARIAVPQTEIFVTFRMKDLVRGEPLEHEKQTARSLNLALLRKAADESAGLVLREMKGVRSYPYKLALLRASIAGYDRGLKGLYCEFGVCKGETLNFIASLVPGEVHGVDSFEGSPEKW
jgi:hypothetical protein